MEPVCTVIFPGIATFRVLSTFEAVKPKFLNVFMINGRCFTFEEADGFSWTRNALSMDRQCFIYGWNLNTVKAFAAKNKTPLLRSNITYYFFGSPIIQDAPPTSPIHIPDIPIDEFSADILVSNEQFIMNIDASETPKPRWVNHRVAKGYDVQMLVKTRRKLFPN